MGFIKGRGQKIALFTAGVPVGAALALGGIAVADRIDEPEVTVMKKVHTLAGQEILSTNVLCKEGQRVISGGHAFLGTYQPEQPVTFPVSSPRRVSDTPGPEDSWNFVVQNASDESAYIELYAICVPLR
ncbi:hypothetical protein [Streptosporangium sp. NPDC051022]|uniref:hypothetical protein n=1 Tax=Streptosporangium sp. NPDC051022 TaxID=3155752 RepID=UPI0034211001